MNNVDKVENRLTSDWICVRQIADELDMPLSSVTSALATLYKFDSSIEREHRMSRYHNRPIYHYRRVD